MAECMVFIYVLKCPDSGAVRYVGKTNNIKKRMSSHLSTRSRLRSSRWIQKLIASGKKPVIDVIEETFDWENRERYWIAFYRSSGCDLLNIDDGGVVATYKHSKNMRKFGFSRKFSRVVGRIAHMAGTVSDESAKNWRMMRAAMIDVRESIMIDMGQDAVDYFDDRVFSHFFGGKRAEFLVMS